MDKRKLLLYLIAGANFTHIVDFMIVMPLGDNFMKVFQINPQHFSWMVSAYTFAAAIAGFVGATFVDKFDRRSMFLVTYAGFIVSTVLCAATTSFHLLLVARAATGIFGGTISALAISMVSDLFDYKERGAAIGILTTAFSVASVIGVPLGLVLADKFSWRMPFIGVAAAAVVIWAAIWWQLPSMRGHLVSKAHQPSPKQILMNVLQDKNQLWGLLLIFVVVLGHFMIIPFITPYMIRNVGFTNAQIPYIYLIGGFLTFFTAPAIGKITDRLGALKVFNVLVIVSMIPVILITNLPPVPIYVALFVTSLFFVFGGSRFIPAQTLVTAAVSAKSRGSFMSIKTSMQQLAAGLASVISGAIVVEQAGTGKLLHYWEAGLLGIIISAVGLFVAPFIKLKE
ncbi:MAG: MFS transporter [Chitinophagales bacterium]|nr:MFS transporter [Bacteroidota bacterium]MCB9043249.1 MFS transporter [Chitinophagales bacterium]